MTDEELKKKAEEYSNWLYHSKAWNPGEDMLVKAYLAGAKEMQKKYEQLVKYCKELEVGFLNYKKNYKTKRQKVFDLETMCKNLEEENEQLKAQIEKMKCCFNCDKPIKHLDCGDCHNGSNWELAQSDRLIRS